MLDVIIIGGGPAGLSAALVLARCRRDVLVIDSGLPRNRRARGLHNYLTRDGIAPVDMLNLARAEVTGYGVRVLSARATRAECDASGRFRVQHHALGADGSQSTLSLARKLILATSVRDVFPKVPGFDDFYGVSILHCPYCDGWEHRDQRLVAYGHGNHAIRLGLSLLTWSAHVTACTDGHPADDKLLAHAASNRLPVRSEPVLAFEGDSGHLRQITFASAPPLPCDAVFFHTAQVLRADDLAQSLGCEFKADGGIRSSKHQQAGIRGLYVAGDADKDVQFVIVAAAEGAAAAIAVNHELQEEDRAPRSSPV